MYEAYFNLQKRPFSSTPDASCFFAPESIQEVFDELILRAENGQGIGILTAQAGTGKTLLCRRLVVELSNRWTPIYLANSNFPTRRALLQSILFELGRPYRGLEEQELRLSVYATLKELTQAGRGVVLIADEAHLLSDRLLEELRMLASLAEGKLPLVRVILAGQPRLEERMLEPPLEALNQRVACHVYLEPLSRRESKDYIAYQIEWAGGICARVFEDAALESIAVGAGGLARCLNQLCDHSLLLAYAQEQSRVTRECVDEALATLRQLPLRWNTPVAAETPLDAVRHDSRVPADSRSDELQLRDDMANVELPLVDQEMMIAERPQSEMACIEIGGDVALPDSDYSATDGDADQVDVIDADSYVDVDQPVAQDQPVAKTEPSPVAKSPVSMLRARPRVGFLGAGVVPLADASPQAMRGMIDELVVDRYARLDSSAPRIYRTFDDATIPESWPTAKQSLVYDDDIPAAPEPPQLPVWSAVDQVIEEIVDGMDENRETELQLVDVPVQEPIDDVSIDQPQVAIDDELGASVLDACREVQAAIDGGALLQNPESQWWHEPILDDSRVDDSRPVLELEADTVIPVPVESHGPESYDNQYDIVEPEHGARVVARDEAEEDAPPTLQSDRRYVPKPKYRNIFSTLRRRIGRGK